MKYIDIYHLLKEKIIKGSYLPYAPLEGEHALAQIYNVSRPTIQKAIARLKRESFVHTRQGAGIFVNPPEFYQDNSVISISERIQSDQKLDNVVLLFDTQPAEGEIAERFTLAQGSLLIHYRRMRIINELPAIIEETWMPYSLFPDFTREDCSHSVLQYIEQTCGLAISHDVKTLSGKSLNQEEAWLLRTEEGRICLSIRHKVFLQSGQMAQYTLETLLSNEVTTVSMR
jgi:DNA-binding GntR family transcriptional regulator